MFTTLALIMAFVVTWIIVSVLRAVLGEYSKRVWFSRIEPRLIATLATFRGISKNVLPANERFRHDCDVNDVTSAALIQLQESATDLLGRLDALEDDLSNLKLELATVQNALSDIVLQRCCGFSFSPQEP